MDVALGVRAAARHRLTRLRFDGLRRQGWRGGALEDRDVAFVDGLYGTGLRVREWASLARLVSIVALRPWLGVLPAGNALVRELIPVWRRYLRMSLQSGRIGSPAWHCDLFR